MRYTATSALALLLAAPLSLGANTSKPNYLIDERTATALVKQCGLEIQIKEFAAQSQAGLIEEMKKSDPASLEKAKKISQNLNSETTVRNAFINRVRQAVSPEANKANLDFCDTEVGKKAIALQKDFLANDGKFNAFVKKYREQPPPQARINWASRVDNAIGMSGSMVDMQYALMKSMLTTINKTVAPDQRKSLPEIEMALSAMRTETEQVARNAAIANYMAVFDDFSDDEYVAYAKFLTSEHGRALIRASYAALVDHAVSTGEVAAKMVTEPGAKSATGGASAKNRTMANEHRHH